MSESHVFNSVGTSIVSEASTLMKPVLYGPDEIVVCAGDVCKHMYFVSDGAMLRESSRGRVTVINRTKFMPLHHHKTKKFINLADRLCFGDGNIVFERASQRESVVTLTFTNLLVLSKEDMMPIWHRNPYDWSEAKSSMAVCLWQEILTSGAFTKNAGIKTTSSWRNLTRSPGRNAFRVISKRGSPHHRRASELIQNQKNRRPSSRSNSRSRIDSSPESIRRRRSARVTTSPSQSPIRSASSSQDFSRLNQKCDQILHLLEKMDSRIKVLEHCVRLPPVPPPSIPISN